MYTFSRVNKGSSEIWQIIIEENSESDLKERFGDAIQFSHRKLKYHEIGYIVSSQNIENKDSIYILLCIKNDLKDNEKQILDQEIEMLIGKSVYFGDGEKTKGWFIFDEMRNK